MVVVFMWFPESVWDDGVKMGSGYCLQAVGARLSIFSELGLRYNAIGQNFLCWREVEAHIECRRCLASL